jgi:hypothetical protein
MRKNTIISRSFSLVLGCTVLLLVAAAPASHNPANDELVNRPAMPAVCYTVWNECDPRS